MNANTIGYWWHGMWWWKPQADAWRGAHVSPLGGNCWGRCYGSQCCSESEAAAHEQTLTFLFPGWPSRPHDADKQCKLFQWSGLFELSGPPSQCSWTPGGQKTKKNGKDCLHIMPFVLQIRCFVFCQWNPGENITKTLHLFSLSQWTRSSTCSFKKLMVRF